MNRPEKRQAIGVSESETRKQIISDLKNTYLLSASNAGFYPTTVLSLIDDFMLRSDVFEMDTNSWNQVLFDLHTSLMEGMINICGNHMKKNLPPAAAPLYEEANMDEDETAAPYEEAIVNEVETADPILLLISNGCEICVVDVKGNSRSEVGYISKIATLKLGQEGLPVSVGLFRRGSYAYMVGGQSFPTDIRVVGPKGPTPNPSMLDAYDFFNRRHFPKVSSSDTYRLSIVNNGTMSADKCTGIVDLKSPKLWPVVAEVEEKVHVFDSFPGSFYEADPDWRFSHEIISVEPHRSLKMHPSCSSIIYTHLILGERIFAITDGLVCLFFDPIKLEWVSVSRGKRMYLPAYQRFGDVWDILLCRGETMCVEEIVVGNDTYYVVLALLSFNEMDENVGDTVIVVAYLVTSKGVIVGRQTLHNFLNGRVKPLFAINRAIIKGGGTDGKTMCIAVIGQGVTDGIIQDSPYFFFSNTFTVERLGNCDSKIKHILEAVVPKMKENAIDGELVRIDIKDRCLYKIDDDDSFLNFSVNMEACFF